VEAVNRDLWRFWVERGYRLATWWVTPGLLRSWQELVRSQCERLARVAAAYRPIVDEITAAIAETKVAEQDLKERQRRLDEWAERPLWYLRLTKDGGLMIVRSDVSGESAPDGLARSLPAVYEDAKEQRQQRLIPVDWDAASLRACDAELAEMATARPPVGATSSGRPMTKPSPFTFVAWFEQEYGLAHNHISGREMLAYLRQERERARSSQSRSKGRPVRPRSDGARIVAHDSTHG
jgi:hypothetical protein